MTILEEGREGKEVLESLTCMLLDASGGLVGMQCF